MAIKIDNKHVLMFITCTKLRFDLANLAVTVVVATLSSKGKPKAFALQTCLR